MTTCTSSNRCAEWPPFPAPPPRREMACLRPFSPRAPQFSWPKPIPTAVRGTGEPRHLELPIQTPSLGYYRFTIKNRRPVNNFPFLCGEHTRVASSQTTLDTRRTFNCGECAGVGRSCTQPSSLQRASFLCLCGCSGFDSFDKVSY